jgi:hypothetical protein
MGWFRRRRLPPAAAEIEPPDLNMLINDPPVGEYPNEGGQNPGHHWNSPTMLMPNLPHERLLTYGGERRARLARTARGRWPISAPYPDDGDPSGTRVGRG